MAWHGGIDEDVGVERVHRNRRSAVAPRRIDRRDEFLRSAGGERGGVAERLSADPGEDLTQPFGVGERVIRSPGSNRIGSDDHGDRLAVAGDGHFLAREHAVEDVWQGRSRMHITRRHSPTVEQKFGA